MEIRERLVEVGAAHVCPVVVQRVLAALPLQSPLPLLVPLLVLVPGATAHLFVYFFHVIE
jgi:hypothetical protein